MKTILIATLLAAFGQLVLAADEAKPNTSVEIKEGGAVTAFDPEQGFKLSSLATKNLGVKFLSLKGAGPWKVPKAALVRIKHSVGVYRRYNGWITMVLVRVLKDEGEHVVIKSIDLQHADEVSVEGAKFLRMTDADLNSETVDSCAH